MTDNFHPNTYWKDRLVLLTIIAKLSERADRIALFKGAKKDRAQKEFDRYLSSQAGIVQGVDLEHRQTLLQMFEEVYDVWERHGELIIDASAWISDTGPTLDLQLPQIPQDVTKHLFVHLGKQPSLALRNVKKEFVEGVYVGPSEPVNGHQSIFLAAVSRRGGRPSSTDRLEKLYLNQSAVVVTRYVDGQFHHVDGDQQMVGDRAVELANKLALERYIATREAFEPAFDMLSKAKATMAPQAAARFTMGTNT